MGSRISSLIPNVSVNSAIVGVPQLKASGVALGNAAGPVHRGLATDNVRFSGETESQEAVKPKWWTKEGLKLARQWAIDKVKGWYNLLAGKWAVFVTLRQDDAHLLQEVARASEKLSVDLTRLGYLFDTARLVHHFDSDAIMAKYPLLSHRQTVKRLEAMHKAQPKSEEIKRLFDNTLMNYVDKQTAKLSDQIANREKDLTIDVEGLGLQDSDGNPLKSVLFEDTGELYGKIPEKTTREALYKRVNAVYDANVTPLAIALFQKSNKTIAGLGYPDLIAFYSKQTGHDLRKLAEKGKAVIEDTDEIYRERMGAFYRARIGRDFSEATSSDVHYLNNGKFKDLEVIDQKFPQEKLMSKVNQTFKWMGLDFAKQTLPVNFATLDEYWKTVKDPEREAGILMDLENREGKNSRACVYVAKAPHEIYFALKPIGGLDDYETTFHEAGHANHYANMAKDMSFPMGLLGNNTVTETYAYLFENLFKNKHWLTNVGNLTEEEASQVVRNAALRDLQMLRRYSSKMQFEVQLYDGAPPTMADKGKLYADLLTRGTGFKYDSAGMSRDIDDNFYVADYFTAWTMEAQLREYMQKRFGIADKDGEDWYTNPLAGAFLKFLWAKGNINPSQLNDALVNADNRKVYEDTTDVGPLMRLMHQNLDRSPNIEEEASL